MNIYLRTISNEYWQLFIFKRVCWEHVNSPQWYGGAVLTGEDYQDPEEGRCLCLTRGLWEVPGGL